MTRLNWDRVNVENRDLRAKQKAGVDQPGSSESPRDHDIASGPISSWLGPPRPAVVDSTSKKVPCPHCRRHIGVGGLAHHMASPRCQAAGVRGRGDRIVSPAKTHRPAIHQPLVSTNSRSPRKQLRCALCTMRLADWLIHDHLANYHRVSSAKRLAIRNQCRSD